MAKPELQPNERAVVERVRRAEPLVHYEVDVGLVRHRALVAGGAPLPDWANALPPSHPWSAAWVKWLSVLALVGAGLLLVLPGAAPSAKPETSRAAQASPGAAAPAGALPVGIVVEPMAETTTSAQPGPPRPRGRTEDSLREQEPLPVGRQATTHTPSEAIDPSTAAQRDGARTNGPLEQHALQDQSRTMLRPREVHKRSLESPVGATVARSRRRAGQGQDATPTTAAAPRNPGVKGEYDVDPTAPQDGEEIRQLVRARRLLHVDPLRSLKLVREAKAHFRNGYLHQERRYVEIRALRALARHGEADAHAAWFVDDYPDSPYVGQVWGEER